MTDFPSPVPHTVTVECPLCQWVAAVRVRQDLVNGAWHAKSAGVAEYIAHVRRHHQPIITVTGGPDE